MFDTKDKIDQMTDSIRDEMLNGKARKAQAEKHQRHMEATLRHHDDTRRKIWELTLTEEYCRTLKCMGMINVYSSMLQLEVEEMMENYKKMNRGGELSVKTPSVLRLVNTIVEKSATLYDKMLTTMHIRKDYEAKEALITILDGFQTMVRESEEQIMDDNLKILKLRQTAYKTGKTCRYCRKLYSKTDPCPVRHMVCNVASEAGCYGAIVPNSPEEREALYDPEYIAKLIQERREISEAEFRKQCSVIDIIIED